MYPTTIRNLALLVMDEAAERRVKIVTAESCTGGLIAGLFTEFSGSSKVIDRGFVTYSNQSKADVLGVAGDVLADYGAVSEPVARLMAEGALENSRANLSIAVTGIAGPGGGTPMKPVGTVHLACARENKAMIHEMLTLGDIGRHEIRMATIESALNMIRAQI